MLHEFFVKIGYGFEPGGVDAVVFKTELQVKTADEFYQRFTDHAAELPMRGMTKRLLTEKVFDNIAADYKGNWKYITFGADLFWE